MCVYIYIKRHVIRIFLHKKGIDDIMADQLLNHKEISK